MSPGESWVDVKLNPGVRPRKRWDHQTFKLEETLCQELQQTWIVMTSTTPLQEVGGISVSVPNRMMTSAIVTA